MTTDSSSQNTSTHPKIIVFTDWDGTVTLQDSNDYLTDNLGMGVEKRREINMEILNESTTFREGFKRMLDSVKTPFPECVDILRRDVKLDPGFADFYKWTVEHDIPVIVLSGGMEPIIRALLLKLVGEDAAKKMPVFSNNVKIEEDGSWEIVYRDESGFGHDKSRAIRPYSSLPEDERPILFYCGDGVSDLSAARETDLLFAKEGRDLIAYCERENVPFNVFSSFTDIFEKIKAVYENKVTVKQLVENSSN